MRQLVTIRFWMTLVALLVALGIVLVVREQTATSPSALDAALDPVEHRVDLIAPVVELQPDASFDVVDGATVGELTLVLDGTRQVTVFAGTPGDDGCRGRPATEPATTTPTCVLAADLLGDAVVWFSLAPVEARPTIELPPIVELRDDGRTLLRNGWELQRASTVERDCDRDSTSLGDFVRRFGPTSTTGFNLAKQEIVKVSCGAP